MFSQLSVPWPLFAQGLGDAHDLPHVARSLQRSFLSSSRQMLTIPPSQSATLDLHRLSASGHTDRLSIAIPAMAVNGPRPHTLTLTVANGIVQQIPVLLIPRQPPALAAPPPPQCAHFMTVSSADAVLKADSLVHVVPCHGAFQSPAGLYPLRYRLAVVYRGAEYPISSAAAGARRVLGPNPSGVLWRVPVFPVVGAEPLSTLRFVVWVYDADGVGRRFESANHTRPLMLGPGGGPALIPEAERLLSTTAPQHTAGDIARAALLLEAAAAAGVASDVIAGLAQRGLARATAQPDSSFADVQLRGVLGRAVRTLLHAGLQGNASSASGLEVLAASGASALGNFANSGPFPGSDPLAVDLVDALSLLLQAAVRRPAVLGTFREAMTHVYAALSQGLVAAQVFSTVLRRKGLCCAEDDAFGDIDCCVCPSWGFLETCGQSAGTPGGSGNFRRR